MHNVARFAGSFGARPTIVLTKFVPLSYHPFSGISAVISNMRRSSLCTDTTTISLSSNVVNVTTAPRGTAFRRRSKTRCFGFSAILASAAAPTVYQYPQLLTSPLQHTLRPTEDASLLDAVRRRPRINAASATYPLILFALQGRASRPLSTQRAVSA